MLTLDLRIIVTDQSITQIQRSYTPIFQLSADESVFIRDFGSSEIVSWKFSVVGFTRTVSESSQPSSAGL
jgi:hypothetical protein